MGRSWEQEKAYRRKRANELKDLMIEDTKRCDKESFRKHMSTARNYMTKKEISPLYTAFITHYNIERRNQ